MAQKSETEYRKTAMACPKHGSTHIQRLITPDPGDYFAAYYTPACCAAYELDRRGPPACNCRREMWQMHRVDCAIVKAHERAYRRPDADAIHAVGCLCGSCSIAREQDAWDPRMGER